MEKRKAITSSQLFVMLFVSCMVVSMTYGNVFVGSSELWDHIISALMALFATWLILVPIYRLFLIDEKMNVFDNAGDLCGKFGFIIIGVYTFYFLVISVHTLSIFEKFITGSINPPISVPLLSILLIVSSCYGAYKGIEALARTSGFIFVAMTLLIIFFILSLLPAVEPINCKPFMYDGQGYVFEGLKFMISQSSCIPALAVLMPMAKGKCKKGIIFWNLGIYIIFAALVYLIIGTMGDFAVTQLFPVYTAAGIGKFGSFKHLDSVYLGIWISGIFIKLSLFLMLAGEGFKKIFGEKFRKISVVIFSGMLVIFAFFENKLNFISGELFENILLWFLLALAVVIPTFLIILKVIKARRRFVKIEKS